MKSSTSASPHELSQHAHNLTRMGIFGNKKKTDTDAPQAASTAVSVPKEVVAQAARDLSGVIVRPHVTEKAAHASDQGVYVFEVRRDATKRDIREAVATIFKVTPVRVNIVHQKPRLFVKRMRNQKGVYSGTKKAYVALKKGDRIELM